MRKTLLTLLVAFVATLTMNAQDLYLSWDGETLGDTITVWGDPSEFEIVAHAVVHNNTDNGMNLKVKRKRISMVEGTTSAFCWGLCFPPDTEESVDPRFVPAGGQSTDEEFSGHYTTNSQIGTSVVEYTFFNQDNEDQNVKVVVKYWASPEGIAEDAMIGGSISSLYPNPATNMINMDYNLTNKVESAQVRIVNLLGSVVKETEMNVNGSKLTMDVSELDGGIYFYSVVINNDVYQTKKLIIQ